ncbi:MAG TPA: histidine kinase [Streptosporangiaceae bacterium]|nr:histidine kinase [Streptosporangiaceae bacterium]
MNTVLRVANLAVRAALLVIVAFITFRHPWPGAWKGAVAVAAVTAATVQLVLWARADLGVSARLRYAFLLPYALAAVTVTCDVAAAGPIGGELMVLAVLAALMAGSDTSLAAGLIVVGAGILACEVMGLFFGATVTTTLEHPAILPIAWMVGYSLRARQVQVEQSAALLAKADQLREEQAKVAALDERARIAREIHDVLAHSLGALGLHIQAAQAVLTRQHDEVQAVELLGQARRLAADGLNETRRAVHALRGETRPLPDGLAELSADHQRRHGARVTFEVSGEPRPLPPDAALALTRTTQEALVNAAKHAPHQPVGISLDYAGAHTSLAVTNHLGEDALGGHGPGLATVNGGYGLAGMRERLLLVKGTLSAGQNGSDWVVMAKVPR